MTDNKKDYGYELLKLSNQVCFPLYACAKEIIRQYSPMLKKLDLTYTQYIVMMVLWEKNSIGSRDLAKNLHLDYGTLTPFLKKMEQNGFIKKEKNSVDERLLTITLTEKGKSLRDQAVEIPMKMAGCVGLAREELEVLYKLTYKALANMEQRDLTTLKN